MPSFEVLSTADGKPYEAVIKVIGVGGGGGNTVNYMISKGAPNIDFIVANTDSQALRHSLAPVRIQLGESGLGAGSHPEIAEQATQAQREDIKRAIAGANLLFITAGMGGGTGTGAAPIIAEVARELGILTIAVVTKPFSFEGSRRARVANAGVKQLKDKVDSMIVIVNERLEEQCASDATMLDCFDLCNEVLYRACIGITDIIYTMGVKNVDFEDIRTMLSERGSAMIGWASATGPNRAKEAAQNAIMSPLVEIDSRYGARALLAFFTASNSLQLREIREGMDTLTSFALPTANIIYGSGIVPDMGDELRVIVLATGLDMPEDEAWLDSSGVSTSLSATTGVLKPIRENNGRAISAMHGRRDLPQDVAVAMPGVVARSTTPSPAASSSGGASAMSSTPVVTSTPTQPTPMVLKADASMGAPCVAVDANEKAPAPTTSEGALDSEGATQETATSEGEAATPCMPTPALSEVNPPVEQATQSVEPDTSKSDSSPHKIMDPRRREVSLAAAISYPTQRAWTRVASAHTGVATEAANATPTSSASTSAPAVLDPAVTQSVTQAVAQSARSSVEGMVGQLTQTLTSRYGAASTPSEKAQGVKALPSERATWLQGRRPFGGQQDASDDVAHVSPLIRAKLTSAPANAMPITQAVVPMPEAPRPMPKAIGSGLGLGLSGAGRAATPSLAPASEGQWVTTASARASSAPCYPQKEMPEEIQRLYAQQMTQRDASGTSSVAPQAPRPTVATTTVETPRARREQFETTVPTIRLVGTPVARPVASTAQPKRMQVPAPSLSTAGGSTAPLNEARSAPAPMTTPRAAKPTPIITKTTTRITNYVDPNASFRLGTTRLTIVTPKGVAFSAVQERSQPTLPRQQRLLDIPDFLLKTKSGTS